MRFASSSPVALSEDWKNAGFGLYVHWPFCQSKCPYCDFNSHVSQSIDQSEWARAYESEIAKAGALTGGRVLNSIFFGGGTPSLMDPDLVKTVIDTAQAQWRFANDIEITLEANPTSVEAGRFAGYADAGVNRVSLGVQSLRDGDLRALGRLHSAEEAQQAFDIARKNFNRVSFDLIYARQDQSLADWRSELTEALSMAIDHVSFYQLTIEPGTAFGDRFAKGMLRGLPSEDLGADMYFLTQELTEAHGLFNYETSNHACPDAESKHNLLYWRSGDYVGIGPGAHGRITLDSGRWATEALRSPAAWLNAVDAETTQSTLLTPEEHADEFLLMGMRLNEGIDPLRYRSISGRDLNPNPLTSLENIGMISISDRIRATDAGKPLLNAIIAELAAE